MSERRLFLCNRKSRRERYVVRDDEWQGQKDSNPQQRFWRPTCYHYTMPLKRKHQYNGN